MTSPLASIPCALVLAFGSAAAEPLTPLAAPAATGAAEAGGPAGPFADLAGWSARWGMSVDEVLRSFPGSARRMEPPLELPNGRVVAAVLPRVSAWSRTFEARFVFADGRLALVSLRPQDAAHPDANYFEALERALAKAWGEPARSVREGDVVDLRETRWVSGGSAADLKFIPGTVALLYHPATASPGR
ncbi:MAG TPA: hypothetical protein VMT17_10580 [Anaeromyxobacteraceae bacterium]|nr:hypothetical protein [Anaeromyxobacteraceae bacterium]